MRETTQVAKVPLPINTVQPDWLKLATAAALFAKRSNALPHEDDETMLVLTAADAFVVRELWRIWD